MVKGEGREVEGGERGGGRGRTEAILNIRIMQTGNMYVCI